MPQLPYDVASARRLPIHQTDRMAALLQGQRRGDAHDAGAKNDDWWRKGYREADESVMGRPMGR